MDNNTTVYIGLGSNQGEPLEQITQALAALAKLPNSRQLHCSPYYRSKAIGPGQQPDYINAVARIQTQLSPHELLKALQQIEADQGRKRHIRWQARTLDLDILLYGSTCLNTKGLTIPHPEMFKRNFVLYPLYDLAPNLQLPNGQPLALYVKNLPKTDLQQLAV